MRKSYRVVEHLRNGDRRPVYERFRARGRFAPDGLPSRAAPRRAVVACRRPLLRRRDRALDPHARWRRTWTQLDASPPAGLIDELVAAYSQPHRAYHTLRHLAECFGQLDASPTRPSEPGSLELALWFHDAVYDTRASDNEARSAAWAHAALVTLGPPTLERIEQLILVTRHDATPANGDEELLLDVDLSILGASASRFDEYEAQIRREYGWVPEEAYRAARARVLAGFQERPVLYHTPWFRQQLEARARANLRRSLASLTAPAPGRTG